MICPECGDDLQTECQTPADIADTYARHYAALLGKEEPDSPHFRFLLGQLSAAATLSHALKYRALDSSRSSSKE